MHTETGLKAFAAEPPAPLEDYALGPVSFFNERKNHEQQAKKVIWDQSQDCHRPGSQT